MFFPPKVGIGSYTSVFFNKRYCYTWLSGYLGAVRSSSHESKVKYFKSNISYFFGGFFETLCITRTCDKNGKMRYGKETETRKKKKS